MGEIATKEFWLAALERAIKSFAGGILAFLTGDALVQGVSLDWGQILYVSALTALASLLLSIVSAGVGNSGPSLGPEQLKKEI